MSVFSKCGCACPAGTPSKPHLNCTAPPVSTFPPMQPLHTFPLTLPRVLSWALTPSPHSLLFFSQITNLPDFHLHPPHFPTVPGSLFFSLPGILYLVETSLARTPDSLSLSFCSFLPPFQPNFLLPVRVPFSQGFA